MNLSAIQKILLTVAIIAIALTFMIIQLGKYAQDTSLSDWKEGAQGYIEGVREQKSNEKPIALFFYTDWCTNCENLRETVLSTKEVSSYMKDYIPIKINPEKGAVENQISTEFNVIGYPTIIIIPKDGAAKRIRKTSNISPAQFIEQCKSAVAI